MSARSVMLVGTSSHVGKSVLCTALCRILHQDGIRVAPFKAQNMSLNSAVTPNAREIGRAQAVQAEAAGIAPTEHMNPILLKPSGPLQSQVVVQGKVRGNLCAREYMRDAKNELWQAVTESYRELARQYEVVVVEGAGSPVELNLKARDLANMRTAELANAAVLLVADIDRGGVFAAVVGTLALLDDKERERVKGVLINKFRGDPALFADGVQLLEERTGIPVVGVIPYLPDLGIEEEDSVGLDSERYRGPTGQTGSTRGTAPNTVPNPAPNGVCGSDPATAPLRVAVVRLPHMANFTDVDPLFQEPQVEAWFCTRPQHLRDAHAIVLPGTKNTMRDLLWLHEQGFVDALTAARARGCAVVGICGGYQMLGLGVRDPHHVESDRDWQPGLCWLAAETVLTEHKRTVPAAGRLAAPFAGLGIEGYEIHMGTTSFTGEHRPFARLNTDSGVVDDGAVALDPALLLGTYLHGVFHSDSFRAAWMDRVRARWGLPEVSDRLSLAEVRAAAFDRLADTVRGHMRVDEVYGWLGLSPRR